ncbi:rhamnose transport system ATP-binding protein [Devosia sp. UYZn731]
MLDGASVSFRSPQDAQRAGIAVMHQHPGLFPDLTLAENVFFGHFIRTVGGTLNWGEMESRTQELLSAIGLDVSSRTRLDQLRISEQQLVEVARALSSDARVLIMDEPTAALSQREVDRLFGVVDGLRSRGVAMMFVGHRMDEIYRVADRIAVLRDGAVIAIKKTQDLPRPEAVRLMVGRELSAIYPARNASPGREVLRTTDLSAEGFDGIDLCVRAGEILGIGGLVGSGRTEVARVLFGIDRSTRGAVELDGKPVRFASAGDAMRAGIAYVSEDRLIQSLVMDFSVRVNGSLTVLEKASRYGLLNHTREIGLIATTLERLKLRFAGFEQPVSSLSGGNQQKVVLAKWLATNPKVLILDEPTQGIDIESKAEVHAMISDLAAAGMAIILISSEMPELLGMCDRIAVLREGRKTAEFTRAQATQEAVLKAATDSISPQANHPGAALVADHDPARRRSLLKSLLLKREAGLVAAIAVVAVPVTLINARMLSPTNLASLAIDAGLLAILALGQMLVMLTRNIDLSVAAVLGLAAYGAASLMMAMPDVGVVPAILLACVIGVAAGFVNGCLIALCEVPSIVATLGTLSVFRGINSLWAGGRQISADKVPQYWLDFATGRVIGLPIIIIFAIILLALAAFTLTSTRLGRELYAIGSNPGGASLIGIPTRRRVMFAFIAAGALAGLCGALWASRYATVDARVATGYELTVIAAVVVGGVAVRGGSGTIAGVVLGALTLLVIRNGLTLVRLDPLWLQGVYGLVILVAIAVDAFVGARSLTSTNGRRIAP